MESQTVTPAAFVDADSEVAAERERCMPRRTEEHVVSAFDVVAGVALAMVLILLLVILGVMREWSGPFLRRGSAVTSSRLS
jgi:hypothetical protein